MFDNEFMPSHSFAMTNSTSNVLLTSEDSFIANQVEKVLFNFGLALQRHRTLEETIKNFSPIQFCLVMIDSLSQPAKSLSLAQEIRQRTSTPIIMFLEDGNRISEDMCLNAGASDFVKKPINSHVLSLRISQQLNRIGQLPEVKVKELAFNDLKLNVETCEFWVNDVLVPLTKTEFYLINFYLNDPFRVFPKAQLLSAMHIHDGIGSDHLIDTHISRLRIKIRKNGGEKYFHAVRGLGVRLTTPQGLQVTA